MMSKVVATITNNHFDDLSDATFEVKEDAAGVVHVTMDNCYITSKKRAMELGLLDKEESGVMAVQRDDEQKAYDNMREAIDASIVEVERLAGGDGKRWTENKECTFPITAAVTTGTRFGANKYRFPTFVKGEDIFTAPKSGPIQTTMPGHNGVAHLTDPRFPHKCEMCGMDAYNGAYSFEHRFPTMCTRGK